jgi:outer membrane receptor protein involved in Fe transport
MADLEGALNETVVSGATKSAQLGSVAPATTTLITAEDLRRYGIHSLDEALNFLSLGMVTQNPLHAVDIGARGVLLTSDFGNHVLLLIDGHAVNEQWNGTAYFERGAAIPFELVDHIEVILGPGSVVYGSNAMLGVINVVTKRAKDHRGLHLIFQADFSSPVDSAGEVRSPSFKSSYWKDAGTGAKVGVGFGHTFNLGKEEAELTGQLEYYNQSGPAFTFGPQNYGLDFVTGEPKRFSADGANAGIWGGVARNSYYTHVPAGLLRLVVGDWDISLRGAAYTRSTPYINSFNTFAGDFDEPNVERDRFLSLDVKYKVSLSAKARLAARLYGDLYDYRQKVLSSAAEDCGDGLPDGCYLKIVGISRWAGLDIQAFYDWFGDGVWVSMVGVDGRIRDVEGDNQERNVVTGAGGSYLTYQNFESQVGVYAQQEFNPFNWLSLNAGLRFDADQRFGSKVSPRAAAAARLWKNGTLRAIYAEAFRAPTSYETNYADYLSQISNPDLRPETVRSFELSAEQKVGSHRVLVGAFGSWWRDMVLLQTISGAAVDEAVARGDLPSGVTEARQYLNTAAIDSWGLNAGLEGSLGFGNFRYGLNLTWAHTRRSADGGKLPLAVAPHFFGNARLSYSFSEGGPTLSTAAGFFGRRPADRAFDGGFEPTPYAPAQLEWRWAFSGSARKWVPGLSYQLFFQYAFAAKAPYVVGPLQQATAEQPSAELAPVNRLQIGLGLEQHF